MTPKQTGRRAVVYARVSVSSEQSVSVKRQVESAHQYAAARGWQIVGEPFVDDGVSATYNKPADRKGWRALLDSPERYDSVIIWKLDRLARKVIDFHLANEALQERGAALVAVENSIDMATSDGKLVANVLASFAEYEADAIRARVKAARDHLLKNGRVVGGTVPYGWRSISGPDGPGYVLQQDPDRIEYVRGMAERAVEGRSIYSTVQWLDEAGAPLPGASQGRRKGNGWVYTTVERILRNPVLAGMTAYNPGNKTKERGLDVLRGPDGLPVVDESVAIMPVAQWRAMVKKLDERDTAQSKPVAMRAKTSGILSGLVICGEHVEDDGTGTRMHRGTVQGRPGYYCPTCHQAISNWEHVAIDEFLRQKGERVRWSVVEEVYEEGAALLPEIEQRLDELDDLIRSASDRDERQRLQNEQGNLLDMRDEKRAQAPLVRHVPVRHTQHFGEDWAEAETDEERRAILGDAIERVWVVRGRPGRRTDAQVLARLAFEWKIPEDLGPLDEG